MLAIFSGVDEVLETSESFLDMLEESLELDHLGIGIATAFEEMIEADDFSPIREYSRRVLDSFCSGECLSPYEAISQFVMRMEMIKDISVSLMMPPGKYHLVE